MKQPRFLSREEAVAQIRRGLPPHPDSGFLGVDLSPKDAGIVVLTLPWDVTTSSGTGTSYGPSTVIPASHQLDAVDNVLGAGFEAGISVVAAPEWVKELSETLRPKAEAVIESLSFGEPSENRSHYLKLVNEGSDKVNRYVYDSSLPLLKEGKIVGILGGDHSSPFGLIAALNELHGQQGFGILHVDAHHDLRHAYEGFSHSHASIFYNVLTSCPGVRRLVQVGIRDYSAEEEAFAVEQKDRVKVYYQSQVFRQRFQGRTWDALVKDMIDQLPNHVYLSFDIDGLDPAFCPSTGTPVPGGLSYGEACYLLEEVALAGKTIVGFDLCEVVPADNGWDQNVGARILYKLACAASYKSRNP